MPMDYHASHFPFFMRRFQNDKKNNVDVEAQKIFLSMNLKIYMDVLELSPSSFTEKLVR